MGEHSPLPWVLMKPAPHLKGCLGSAHGFYISSFEGKTETPLCHLFTVKKDYEAWTEEVFPFLNDEADAAYIVQACNAFPDLLKVLKDISPLALLLPQELADQVVAAIAKAGA